MSAIGSHKSVQYKQHVLYFPAYFMNRFVHCQMDPDLQYQWMKYTTKTQIMKYI